jgi:hypothetical protein
MLISNRAVFILILLEGFIGFSLLKADTLTFTVQNKSNYPLTAFIGSILVLNKPSTPILITIPGGQTTTAQFTSGDEGLVVGRYEHFRPFIQVFHAQDTALAHPLLKLPVSSLTSDEIFKSPLILYINPQGVSSDEDVQISFADGKLACKGIEGCGYDKTALSKLATISKT